MSPRKQDWWLFILVLLVIAMALVALMVNLSGCGGQAEVLTWEGVEVEVGVEPDCQEVGVELFISVDQIIGSIYCYVNVCEQYVLACVTLPFWITTPCVRLDFDEFAVGLTNKPPMPVDAPEE
jgi:hypothetical protein